MNQRAKRSGGTDGSATKPEARTKTFLVVGIAMGILCVGALLKYVTKGKPESKTAGESVSPLTQKSSFKRPPIGSDRKPTAADSVQNSAPETAVADPSAAAIAPANPVAPTTATEPPRAEPTPYTRQLVASLAQIDLSRREITPEQAGQWKQTLQQLAQRGPEAVPAIREFLERNVDLSFDAMKGGNLVGQPSVRMALIDALGGIGGPDALAVSLQVLQSTTEPREIAQLAKNLDQQAPEQYRQASVNAAREALALAASGKLEERDVGPLFTVLQQYGGADAVPDLEKATGRWRYYGAIALADMPGGAGLPSLIQMAQDPHADARSRVALEVLAQVSTQYPEAAATLIEQARGNKLPMATWFRIADTLAGSSYEIGKLAIDGNSPTLARTTTYHLSLGNQNFFSAPGATGLTPEQVNQRVALIDQLLAVNANPDAAGALQKSRTLLLNGPKP